MLGSHNQNLDIFRNIGDSFNPDFLSDNCIEKPYYGMNTKPDLYTNNDMIFSLIGLSTGGVLHSIYNPSIYGDVSQDNMIDILDILMMIQYIIGSTDEINFCLADTNADNMIDLFDIMFLINQIIS